MGNGVNVDPRYLDYNKDEVEDLLGKVDNADDAPTEDSENMIKSGAVFGALQDYATKEAMSEATAAATEEEIRDIVRNYDPEGEDSSSSSE